MAKHRKHPTALSRALISLLAIITFSPFSHAQTASSLDFSRLTNLTARWESSLHDPSKLSPEGCQQQVSSFLHSRCATPTKLQAWNEDGDAEFTDQDAERLEASAGPPQAEKMRISIEVTRCEIEGAGLKMPAECSQSRLQTGEAVQLEGQIRGCVEWVPPCCD